MPSYEYKCPTHGQRTIIQTMEEAREKHPCPECGTEMQRLWFAAPDVWKTKGNFGRGDNKR